MGKPEPGQTAVVEEAVAGVGGVADNIVPSVLMAPEMVPAAEEAADREAPVARAAVAGEAVMEYILLLTVQTVL